MTQRTIAAEGAARLCRTTRPSDCLDFPTTMKTQAV